MRAYSDSIPLSLMLILSTVTQAQYDTAKDIILDLLGWGVPPDYLIRCGLSREMVYYAFLDFNLRLPDNFDITGLPTSQDLTAMATNLLARRSRQTSVSASPTRPRPSSLQTTPARSNVPLPENAAESSHAAAAPPAIAPSTRLVDKNPDLHDMEQQRRRELLARKAVQASRKAKQAAALDSPVSAPPVQASATPADVDRSTPVVAPMAVDDFLNSIERDSSREGSRVPISRLNSLDDMDVDGPPGLSLMNDMGPMDHLKSERSVSDEAPPMSASSASTSTSLRQASPLQRTATEKFTPVPSGSSSSSGSATPPVSSAGVSAPLSRRGTKRPVASDFVDVDPGASRTGNGQIVYASHYRQPYTYGPPLKRLEGFAVVSSKPRRMVIELTDSEDDDDEQIPSTRLRTESAQSRSAVQDPSTAQNELLEHERAIRDLKEKIARKELEARLKREAAVRKCTSLLGLCCLFYPQLASGRGTPTNRSGTPTASSVVVKQEEDDSSASVPFHDRSGVLSADEPPDSGASFTPNNTESSKLCSGVPSLSDSTMPSTPVTPETPIGSLSCFRPRLSSTHCTSLDIALNTLQHTSTGDKGV